MTISHSTRLVARSCKPCTCQLKPRYAFNRRCIQIQATPSSASPSDTVNLPISSSKDPPGSDSPTARFEVLGSPFSLLSVFLSASQSLYTRRGTLVSVSGKAENVVSNLSLLEPFRRALLGIPFLYQKISSTNPTSALISTKSPLTSFAVLHLDGTVDWMVAQRKALLAWTGHSLFLRPTTNFRMSLAHWGNTECAGRGLLALAGQGQIYEIVLKAEEEYIVHPSNVVAYTITPSPPMPFRFKSSTFRLQIPHLGFSSVLPASKFLQMIRASGAWKGLAKSYYFLRTWARRSIWGDRLFLRFQGPATILLQSRAARVSDVLTAREVDELAESPPGTVQSAMISMDRQAEKESEQKRSTTRSGDLPTRLSTASVGPGGKVEFEDAEDFKSLTPKR